MIVVIAVVARPEDTYLSCSSGLPYLESLALLALLCYLAQDVFLTKYVCYVYR